MTRVLGLDLGTNCGFAVGEAGKVTTSGTWDFGNHSRFESGGARYLRFRHALKDLHEQTKFTDIVFEEVHRHRGTAAAHVYGGMFAMMAAWADNQNPKLPYIGVGVGTIKRHWTGKGNASKTEMIDAACKRGFSPKDDNHADALAICFYYMEELDEPAKISEMDLLA